MGLHAPCSCLCPRVTGEDLVSAAVQRNPTSGSLSIGFRLSSEGGRKFATLTRNYKAHGPKNPTDHGRQLAIILDQLVSQHRRESLWVKAYMCCFYFLNFC